MKTVPYARIDEGTNVHSGFTRHMTAAATTLNKTTPRAVVYRATYWKPNSVPDCERATTFDLQDPQEARQGLSDSGPDVAVPLWRKPTRTLG